MSSSSLPQVIVLPKPGLPDVYHAEPDAMGTDAFKTLTFCAFRKLPDGSHQLVSATANASFDPGPKGSSSLILTIHASGNRVDLLADPGTDFGAHILIKKRYGSIVQGKSVRELLEEFNRTRTTSLKETLAICALQYELQTQVLTYRDVVPPPPMNTPIPPPPVTPQPRHQSNDDDAANMTPANMFKAITGVLEVGMSNVKAVEGLTSNVKGLTELVARNDRKHEDLKEEVARKDQKHDRKHEDLKEEVARKADKEEFIQFKVVMEKKLEKKFEDLQEQFVGKCSVKDGDEEGTENPMDVDGDSPARRETSAAAPGTAPRTPRQPTTPSSNFAQPTGRFGLDGVDGATGPPKTTFTAPFHAPSSTSTPTFGTTTATTVPPPFGTPIHNTRGSSGLQPDNAPTSCTIPGAAVAAAAAAGGGGGVTANATSSNFAQPTGRFGLDGVDGATGPPKTTFTAPFHAPSSTSTPTFGTTTATTVPPPFGTPIHNRGSSGLQPDNAPTSCTIPGAAVAAGGGGGGGGVTANATSSNFAQPTGRFGLDGATGPPKTTFTAPGTAPRTPCQHQPTTPSSNFAQPTGGFGLGTQASASGTTFLFATPIRNTRAAWTPTSATDSFSVGTCERKPQKQRKSLLAQNERKNARKKLLWKKKEKPKLVLKRQPQREIIKQKQKKNESIKKATATSVNTNESNNISKGMNVHYTKNNVPVKAKVIDVQFDDGLEPYYVIETPDGEPIRTVAKFLSLLANDENSAAGAPVQTPSQHLPFNAQFGDTHGN